MPPTPAAGAFLKKTAANVFSFDDDEADDQAFVKSPDAVEPGVRDASNAACKNVPSSAPQQQPCHNSNMKKKEKKRVTITIQRLRSGRPGSVIVVLNTSLKSGNAQSAAATPNLGGCEGESELTPAARDIIAAGYSYRPAPQAQHNASATIVSDAHDENSIGIEPTSAGVWSQDKTMRLHALRQLSRIRRGLQTHHSSAESSSSSTSAARQAVTSDAGSRDEEEDTAHNTVATPESNSLASLPRRRMSASRVAAKVHNGAVTYLV